MTSTSSIKAASVEATTPAKAEADEPVTTTATTSPSPHPLQQALKPRPNRSEASVARPAAAPVAIAHRMRRGNAQQVFFAHVAAAKESFRRGGYTAEEVAQYHLGEHADQKDFNELVAILKSTS
jgi:hypothetical protein